MADPFGITEGDPVQIQAPLPTEKTLDSTAKSAATLIQDAQKKRKSRKTWGSVLKKALSVSVVVAVLAVISAVIELPHPTGDLSTSSKSELYRHSFEKFLSNLPEQGQGKGLKVHLGSILERGDRALRQKDMNTAKEKYTTLIKEYETHVGGQKYPLAAIYNNLGHIATVQGNAKEAKDYFEKAVESSTTHIESRINLGYIYVDDKKLEEAGKLFAEVLFMDETNVNALIGMGNAYRASGEKKGVEGALEFYRRALDVQPENTLVLGNMGINLCQLQKFEEGLGLLKKAKSLGHTGVDEMIERTEQMIQLRAHAEADGVDVSEWNLPGFQKL